MTAPKLFALTVSVAVVSIFFVWVVINFEPPAFIGYFFGALCGAQWGLLVAAFARYWEETS